MTASNWLAWAPAGSGIDCSVHADPSQRWAIADLTDPTTAYPTAVHVLEIQQLTSCSVVVVAPGGFTVLWTDHEVPFQRSARLTSSVAVV
ncbi:hypothetical protein [Conexibacter woesei]|uniref:hypothetical protein n=1 Tax=Conexibacter woesei TaxID=191495 RepID=UPI0011D27E88|nr:hypothetical protein [Conexibacter woesei]